MGPAGGDAPPGAINQYCCYWILTCFGFIRSVYIPHSRIFNRKGGESNGDEESPGKKSEKDHQKEIAISKHRTWSMIDTCYFTTKLVFVVLFLKSSFAFSVLLHERGLRSKTASHAQKELFEN